MEMMYKIVKQEDGTENITVFYDWQVYVAERSHPYWDDIVQGAMNNDPAIVDLFNLAAPAARKFEALSDRVTVENNRVYFDGDEINNALTEQISRFIREGVEDWQRLVNFFEKVMTNLNEHSREQLFAWLEHQDLRITPEGNFTAYKGVRTNDVFDNETTFQYESISHGTAFVDGKEFHGAIPNYIGAVVTMPRSQVQHDPSVGCHTGLHAGTWNYASGFAQGAVLEVEIDPRDVVSVPTDCNAQKLRVSRYVVRDVTEQKRESVVADYEDDEGDFDPDYEFDRDNEYF